MKRGLKKLMVGIVIVSLYFLWTKAVYADPKPFYPKKNDPYISQYIPGYEKPSSSCAAAAALAAALVAAGKKSQTAPNKDTPTTAPNKDTPTTAPNKDTPTSKEPSQTAPQANAKMEDKFILTDKFILKPKINPDDKSILKPKINPDDKSILKPDQLNLKSPTQPAPKTDATNNVKSSDSGSVLWLWQKAGQALSDVRKEIVTFGRADTVTFNHAKSSTPWPQVWSDVGKEILSWGKADTVTFNQAKFPEP